MRLRVLQRMLVVAGRGGAYQLTKQASTRKKTFRNWPVWYVKPPPCPCSRLLPVLVLVPAATVRVPLTPRLTEPGRTVLIVQRYIGLVPYGTSETDGSEWTTVMTVKKWEIARERGTYPYAFSTSTVRPSVTFSSSARAHGQAAHDRQRMRAR